MVDLDELLGWMSEADAILADPRLRTDLAALHRAVDQLRRADAALHAELAEVRPVLIGNLGGALISMFERDPQQQYIDDAIRVLSSETDPFTLNHLCLALRARYHEYGQIKDLLRAVEASRRAAADAPDERAAFLANCGMVLQELYEAQPHPGLLDEAVNALRAALEIAPDDPSCFQWMMGLANTYVVVARRSG